MKLLLGFAFLLFLCPLVLGQTVYNTFPPSIISAAWWANIQPAFQAFETRFNNKADCTCPGTGVPCNTWAEEYPILKTYTTSAYTDIIPGVGAFGPQSVGMEYDRVILGQDGTDCNTLFHLRTSDLGSSTHSYYVDPVDGNFCLTHGEVLNLTIDYRIYGGHLLRLDGLVIINTVCFDPATQPAANITRFISIPDEVQLKGLAANAATVNATQICQLIQSSCPVGTQLQQYTDQNDCETYLNSLPQIFGVCPTSQDSNTVNCRFLHEAVALLPPTAPGEPVPATIHCPHTGKNSMTCVDRCLPACSACSPQQHCVNLGDPVHPSYTCVCNDGYVTSSGGGCQPVACTQNYQCQGDTGNTGVCNLNTGLCGCSDTFTWNPTAGKCQCPSGKFVSWASPDGLPKCIPVGRCFSRYECTHQIADNRWSNVLCAQYGENPYAFYDTCICAPGFQGSFMFACSCPSPGKIVWSNNAGSNVCLQPGQCANPYDCSNGQSCHLAAGSVIGTCQ